MELKINISFLLIDLNSKKTIIEVQQIFLLHQNEKPAIGQRLAVMKSRKKLMGQNKKIKQK